MDEQTTRISSRKRRVIVSWTLGADNAPPAAITAVRPLDERYRRPGPQPGRRWRATTPAAAADYAGGDRPHTPTAEHVEALKNLAASAGPGGRVLEVASGPGWDADRLEAMGLEVRRTDLSGGLHRLPARARPDRRPPGPDRRRPGRSVGRCRGPVRHPAYRERPGRRRDRPDREGARPGGTLLMSFQEGEEETTVEVVRDLPGGALVRRRHDRPPVATGPVGGSPMDIPRQGRRLDHGNRAPFLRSRAPER